MYQNNWATFVRKFVTKKFKNRPIWSHCPCVYHVQHKIAPKLEQIVSKI